MSTEDFRTNPRNEIPSTEMIKRLAEIASHPQFQKLVREIEAKPESERRKYAEMVAKPEEFARRGIPTPTGFRVTTRYFEAPGAPTTTMETLYESRPAGAPGTLAATLCVSVGFGVCASIGDTLPGTLASEFTTGD